MLGPDIFCPPSKRQANSKPPLPPVAPATVSPKPSPAEPQPPTIKPVPVAVGPQVVPTPVPAKPELGQAGTRTLPAMHAIVLRPPTRAASTTGTLPTPTPV